ncbi:MAG TPA: cytochrome c biogenesis protein CcsA [Herpetosiphonaceae bacterium]
MNLGNTLLALAITSGLTAMVSAILWARGVPQVRGATLLFLRVMVLCISGASVVQVINLLTHQFQYTYVASFSDRSLPPLLLAATFWAGQAGSLLLWALGSSLLAWVLAHRLRASPWAPFVLVPYLGMTVAIMLITLVAAPFATQSPVPADGAGLNPLLQNGWMIIHPPILFSGFTAMTVPFAFAVAALWRGSYETWVPLARPWVILAWCCLGTGLALGGVWAYESLGWGGFWGWDPVENSSLVPWLIVSALLHGMLLQQGRQRFQRTNLVLALSGYLLVLYSTFLTRSGILGTFSVHSFVELGLTGYLVVLMGGGVLLSGALLRWRWRSIPRAVIYTRVVSREFGLLLSALLFLIIMAIVLIGTSMPVISRLPGFSHQMSVDLDFYSPVVAPFGLLLVLAMAVGPLLTWDHTRYGRLQPRLRLPLIGTGVAVFAALLLNITYPVALLFIAAGTLALGTNLVMIVQRWRAGLMHLGGYLSHAGVGLLVMGVVSTGWYKQTAALQLIQDVPQGVFGRLITFRGMTVPADDPLQRAAVQLEVTEPDTGRTWIAEAPYYTFAKSGQLVIHPAIDHGMWQDLYVAPSQVIPAARSGPDRLILTQDQPQPMGGYLLSFQRFALVDRAAMAGGQAPAQVGAVVQITAPTGQTWTVTPTMQLAANQAPFSPPISVADGTIALAGLAVEAQQIELQLAGRLAALVASDDLSARVYLDMTREPGIRLVWAGMLLTILGGGLSGLGRWWATHRRRAAAEQLPAVPAPWAAVEDGPWT